jgi:hypothetical protein
VLKRDAEAHQPHREGQPLSDRRPCGRAASQGCARRGAELEERTSSEKALACRCVRSLKRLQDARR